MDVLRRERERRDREQQAPRPVLSADPSGIQPAASADGIRVYFSPNGQCTEAIVAEIGKATTDVKVQAYRLTSIPVAKAINEAHKRGVKVSIILDRTQQSPKYSDATYYHNAGIAVLIDDDHPIAHNKCILIDERTVITGSFNFSAKAERNSENLLIIEGKPEIAAAYVQNFNDHTKHSNPYRPPSEPYNGQPLPPAPVEE